MSKAANIPALTFIYPLAYSRPMKIPTSEQLKEALKITVEIEALESKVAKIMGITATTQNGRRKMSAAARAKIAAGQRARWAKSKGKKKRTMSAAARAKIAAAAKLRWKKAKAEGKNTL